jgi:hypothetical protein
MKELNKQPFIAFTENYRSNWRNHSLPISPSKLFFIMQLDEGHSTDPTSLNAGVRL